MRKTKDLLINLKVNMKGLILAGGLGKRLYPLTKITNKHLLPVYDRPMIYFPLLTLVKAGIKDIMIITGGNNAGDFIKLLGNGHSFGLKYLHYAYQEKELGIANAIALAEEFIGEDLFTVILGDNIFENDISGYVKEFEKIGEGAMILLKKVPNPKEYGIAFISENRIVKIIEKPKNPKSNLAVVGLYMYDNTVFKQIKKLTPSKRGEYEITDINNYYLNNGRLHFKILDGWWGDAGENIDKLLEVNNYVANKLKKEKTHWWNTKIF